MLVSKTCCAPGSVCDLSISPPPRVVQVLLFLFGAAQFFVEPEPGLPEFIFPVLLLFTQQRALAHPAHVLLLGSNLIAMVVEAALFGTIRWSVISLYLTLVSVALLSVFRRYDRYLSARALLIGAGFGALVTLAALATPLSSEMYRYGIRFTGFFKDPNVTAPTALFFAIAILAVRGRWRWMAVFPFAVFLIALSRATYLAGAVVLVYVIAVRNRTAALTAALGVGIGALFFERIERLIDSTFNAIGRQGLVNTYDLHRRSNWISLLELAWAQRTPLGPGFSESHDIAVHSTYLRLLVEQGLLPLLMFGMAMWFCWRSARGSVVIRAGLLCLLINGLVVDSTHWRVLFCATALALAWSDGTGPDAWLSQRLGTRPLRPTASLGSDSGG